LKPKRHGGKRQQHAEFPGTPELVQEARLDGLMGDQVPQHVSPTKVLEVEHQMEPPLLGHVAG